jgi:hypothetical protein
MDAWGALLPVATMYAHARAGGFGAVLTEAFKEIDAPLACFPSRGALMVGGEFGKCGAACFFPFTRPYIIRSKQSAIVIKPYPALFAAAKLI